MNFNFLLNNRRLSTDKLFIYSHRIQENFQQLDFFSVWPQFFNTFVVAFIHKVANLTALWTMRLQMNRHFEEQNKYQKKF